MGGSQPNSSARRTCTDLLQRVPPAPHAAQPQPPPGARRHCNVRLELPHPISTVPVSNPTTLWVAGPALRSVSQRHQLYRIVAAALQAQQHVRATQWRSRRRLDLASDRFATVRGCVRRRSRGNGDPVRTQGEIHTADDLLCSVGRAGHTSKLCVLRCATKRMKAAWADGRLVLQLSCLSAVVDKRCV